MKSILDLDFKYTPSAETDIRATFERVWRELGTRDRSQPSPVGDCKSVWLECDGELVDVCSVQVLRIRKSHVGFAILEFVCPRCKHHHESLQFR